MTAGVGTATRPSHTAAATGGSTLTGTWGLVRLMLRRDRIKLPAWTLGIGLFVIYYVSSLPALFPDQQSLEAVKGFTQGPVGALLGGPMYGFDQLTLERFLVGMYGLYFLIAAGLMSILLVSRHTRVEEQTGRAELIRANVVGRNAQLTATLILAVIANVVVSLLVTAALLNGDFDPQGALVTGAGVGACGLAFAGVAALTMQITEYSRTASGMAGAVLGAAYVIRAAGDMLGDHGSLLSWFSPLAWSQQTRAFVDERWWPLLLSLAFAVITAAIGYRLSSRRDHGAGLMAARRGSAVAAPWLRSAFSLAFRLQRASIIGWGCALVVTGALYGGITDAMLSGYEDFPDEMVQMMGGTEDLMGGYLGLMAVFESILVGIFAILAVQSLRSDETKGRVEPVLATAVSRWAWFGTQLAVTAIAVVGLLLAVGLATAVGAAASTGDGSLVWDVTVAHVVRAPEVLVILAVAALAFGIVPRAIGIAWALLVYGGMLAFFGPILDLPQAALNVSPFEHIARMPLEDFSAAPVLILLVLAGAGLAVALRGFRQRDLESA